MRVKKILSLLFIVGLLYAVLWAYLTFMESKAPEIILTPEKQMVSMATEFHIQASDAGRGLKEIRVDMVQEGRTIPILQEKFNEEIFQWAGAFSLAGHKIANGPAELFVSVSDNSLNKWGKGNSTIIKRSVTIDSVPPRISIIDNTQYINQGGCGVISYKLSEDVAKTGVTVADRFFPAYKQDEQGTWICLFGFPYYADPDTDRLELIARDEADNEAKVHFFQRVRKTSFRHDTIHIDDRFLQNSMPSFQQYFPFEHDLLKLYLKVNNELRKENRALLSEIGLKSVPYPMWKGSFLQLPNSATRAGFGDKRTYLYKGEKIDNQVHLGLDFASIARAPVGAANDGTVVLAEIMGIYGQVVIIDHGLGLQSLYAHLSQIDVAVGDDVKRGDIIGNTGVTGLAGGDHLHLGIIVSGLPVNPIEWLDAKWIKNSITLKMNPGNTE